MKHYNYRKGTPADIEQLRLLAVASYGQYKEILGEEAWKKMEASCGNEDTYKELFRIAECFVCEDGNTIIGMVFLIPQGHPRHFFQADWAYIRLLGVLPAYGGKGIGRKLTELCLASAKQSGEKILALHTSEFQDAARHIYESMGFKVLKPLEPIYGKKYWLYTLILDQAKEPIRYRKAGPGDLEALVELRIRFTTLLTGIDAPDRVKELKEHSYHYFTKALKGDSGIWIIASCGDKAVGTGGVLVRYNPPNFKNMGGAMGYYVNMYTVPEFRRQGICSRIMNLLEEEALKLGIRFFELHATKEGELVYRQQGFEMHDEPTYRKYIR